MRRTIDVFLSLVGLMIAAPVLATVAVIVKITSPGPVIYWSVRVGRDNTTFRMPKFRTMRVDTPEVATDLLAEPGRYLTAPGSWLRRLSLDELPQLWSILVGHMSFVGPRPALHNQDDLIALRTACGVHRLTPGLTGWAQVNGRDTLPVPAKVELDLHYLRHRSLRLDALILVATVVKAIRGEGVAH